MILFKYTVSAMHSQPPTQNNAASLGEPLPAHVEAALWRGGELRPPPAWVRPSGWAALDAELPGGGWPCRCITELLVPQPGVLEWRLLTPALRPLAERGGDIVVVAPPRQPFLGGLVQDGLDPDRFLRIQVHEPARRLWVTEQLLKANASDVVISWLPQVRQEQLRRLQTCATGFEGLCFLVRPIGSLRDSSAAPLRVAAALGADWNLDVRIAKRRGPVHENTLALQAIPGGLAGVLTPELMRPSQLDPATLPFIEVPYVVGGSATPSRTRQASTH